MMNKEEMKKRLLNLAREIDYLSLQSGFDNEDRVILDGDNDDFYETQTTRILKNLSDAASDIEYIHKPIRMEGTLTKGPNDRYVLDGYELTSGQPIEAYIYSDYFDRNYWVNSRIEHNDGYYLYGHKDIPLEGLKARIR